MNTAGLFMDLTKTGVRCIICGSDAWEVRIELDDFYIRQCQVCGLGQTYPIPTQEQLSYVNKSSYNVERMSKAYKLRHNELVQRYMRQLNKIEHFKITPGKKLLDVGCNLGFFMSVAQAQGYEVYGVEISAETARYAREQLNLDVVCGTLEQARYPDRSFDVITLWDVIEHVPQPINLLGEVYRILHDDGILALQSPNMESAMSHFAGRRWRWWLAPDHQHHFTPSSMTRLLEMNGFQIVLMQTWEPPKDFTMELLGSLIPAQFTGGKLPERVLRGGTFLLSQVIWPLVIPYQRYAWKQNRGALITIYGRKS